MLCTYTSTHMTLSGRSDAICRHLASLAVRFGPDTSLAHVLLTRHGRLDIVKLTIRSVPQDTLPG